ncbi:hypothetical protein OIU84_024595, partial [Salix udensis]
MSAAKSLPRWRYSREVHPPPASRSRRSSVSDSTWRMATVLPRAAGPALGVKDTDTMASVPRDGETTGEIVTRGSGIMKGYFKDPEATSNAFEEWMVCSSEILVSFIPMATRKSRTSQKDVIIYGGENIATWNWSHVLYGTSKSPGKHLWWPCHILNGEKLP